MVVSFAVKVQANAYRPRSFGCCHGPVPALTRRVVLAGHTSWKIDLCQRGETGCQLVTPRSGRNPTRRLRTIAKKLERSQWSVHFDLISKAPTGKRAEIEVASLNRGDQIEAEWLPFFGISYDPRDDLIALALEGRPSDPQSPRNIHRRRRSGVVQSRGYRRGWRASDPRPQRSSDAAGAIRGKSGLIVPTIQRSKRMLMPWSAWRL
jgi:hypothetical protein